jgi:hypothetical protein
MNGGQAHLADGYVTKLDPTGSSLVYSTFLGTPNDDVVHGIVVDDRGAATVVGFTNGPAFPTTNGAFSRLHKGGTDMFVTTFAPNGRSLLGSTLFGGSADDCAEDVALEPGGGIIVGGSSRSADLPVSLGAYRETNNGGNDIVVARFAPDLKSLRYGTHLGGLYDDWSNGVRRFTSGDVVVGGTTCSGDFPRTIGPPVQNGCDATVTRLDLLPTGVTRFGNASAGCVGPAFASAESVPRIGNGAFGVRGSGTPDGAVFLALSARVQIPPIRVDGLELWLDPFAPFFLFPAVSVAGEAWLGLPIPNDGGLAGGSVFVQWLWPEGCISGGIAASNGLGVAFQR